MFKSVENTDQDDYFDFLRMDAPSFDLTWIKENPLESKLELNVDPLSRPISQTNSDSDSILS